MDCIHYIEWDEYEPYGSTTARRELVRCDEDYDLISCDEDCVGREWGK